MVERGRSSRNSEVERLVDTDQSASVTIRCGGVGLWSDSVRGLI